MAFLHEGQVRRRAQARATQKGMSVDRHSPKAMAKQQNRPLGKIIPISPASRSAGRRQHVSATASRC